jgi:hypothetical protein
VITVGHWSSDNRMITIYELPCLLNEPALGNGTYKIT